TLNLYDVSALAHAELAAALAAAGSPQGLDVNEADVLGDLRDQLDSARGPSNKDPFGLGLPYGGGDATPHAFGLALMADLYRELPGGDAYADLERTERGWIFGNNAWGSTFVVGAGSVFPQCVHHQIANLAGSLDGTGAILRGAVVDGAADPGDFEG